MENTNSKSYTGYTGGAAEGSSDQGFPLMNASKIMPKGPSEIDQELAGAHGRVQEIDVILSTLENKISGVMYPPNIEDTTSGSKNPSRVTSIGRSLQDLNVSLDYRINRLNDIIKRIEL